MTAEKILVVDDEDMIVALCRDVLAEKGYQVTVASCGEEALELAAAESFDLVVLDMLMPGLDGLETFGALKEKQPELVGLLITAHGTIETAIESMKLGFSGFVRKPFSPFELIQAVRDTLQKAALITENARLRTLIPLYQLGEKFIRSQTKQGVWDELIRTVHDQTGAERISVMLYHVAEDSLQIAAAIGMDPELIGQVCNRAGEKIAGWVFEHGEPVVLNGGPEDNPRFASFMKSNAIAAAISFPLQARDRTLGVLNISKLGEAPPFSEVDIEMLSIICSQAAMAAENVRIMEERAERIRTRTLLEQYVAPEVAERLLKHGHNPIEVGEIREITVLFADIRNFTPLVTHLNLNDLRAFLNAFFDMLSEIIFRFQGTLDKFMGDAVLALFGSLIAVDKPQRAAAYAAVEMLRSFESLKQEWSGFKRVFDDIGLGIGISCGEVFLGNVGSQKRLDYTVIGSGVNLAQRLGAEALSGQILISEDLQAIEESSLRIEEESERVLRGWDKPMRVFSIVPQ